MKLCTPCTPNTPYLLVLCAPCIHVTIRAEGAVLESGTVESLGDEGKHVSDLSYIFFHPKTEEMFALPLPLHAPATAGSAASASATDISVTVHFPSDSIFSLHHPNPVTMAFSIKSFRDHTDFVRRQSSVVGRASSIAELFPSHLVKSASLFGLADDPVEAAADLLRNVAAIVIQASWRAFAAREFVKILQMEREKTRGKMHDQEAFEVSVQVMQSTARRYLARKAVAERRASLASTRKTPFGSQTPNPREVPAQERTPSSDALALSPNHRSTLVIGTLAPGDLPVGSVFNENGERIRDFFEEGGLVRECAAVVIQRKVKQRVQERFLRVKSELRKQRLSLRGVPMDDDGRPIGLLARKYSAAESVMTMMNVLSETKTASPKVPSPPSLGAVQRALQRNASVAFTRSEASRTNSRPGSAALGTAVATTSAGQGLAAVFWDAAGLLLNPRRTAFDEAPSGSLWGLRVLHDVSMSRRQMYPDLLPRLPLTIWVQGPLESQERTKQRSARLVAQSPAKGVAVVARALTPREKQRPTASAARRLSPLGRSPRQLYSPNKTS